MSAIGFLTRSFALVCLGASFTSCTQWSGPKATYEQLSVDRAACNSMAIQNVPPVARVQFNFYYAATRFVPSGANETDLNALARARAFAECMISHGWRDGEN